VRPRPCRSLFLETSGSDRNPLKDALGFLRTREIAHQKSFEKALYAITDNFPPGKLPGIKPFADAYVNTSKGDADVNASWNSGKQWDRVDDLDQTLPADGGDGQATVELGSTDMTTLKALAARTMSQQSGDPKTGADLGAGPGAGKVTEGDKGGAGNMDEAKTMARKRTAA
jgi:Mn-containing catalase